MINRTLTKFPVPNATQCRGPSSPGPAHCGVTLSEFMAPQLSPSLQTSHLFRAPLLIVSQKWNQRSTVKALALESPRRWTLHMSVREFLHKISWDWRVRSASRGLENCTEFLRWESAAPACTIFWWIQGGRCLEHSPTLPWLPYCCELHPQTEQKQTLSSSCFCQVVSHQCRQSDPKEGVEV